MSKKKILIVDDEPVVIELLGEELEDLGYEFLSASNGKEGLDTYLKHPDIACIISDIKMPDYDGIFLAKALLEQNYQGIVYLATGFTEYTAKELESLGIEAVIFKPFIFSEIAEAIDLKLKN